MPESERLVLLWAQPSTLFNKGWEDLELDHRFR